MVLGNTQVKLKARSERQSKSNLLPSMKKDNPNAFKGTSAPKVFKLKSFSLAAGAEVRVEKVHNLKPVTTRVHYAGLHAIELQINGRSVAKINWNLRLKELSPLIGERRLG